MLPASELMGTLHVTPHGEGKCEALWLLNFEPLEDRLAPDIRKNVLGM